MKCWSRVCFLTLLAGAAASPTGKLDCDETFDTFDTFDTCDDEIASLQVSLLQSSLKTRSSVLTDASVHSGGQFPSLYWAACCGLLVGGLRFVASDKGVAAGLPELSLILTFVFWMSWFQYFSGDPFDAFVESMTQCPLPQPGAHGCPSGTRLQEGVCIAEGRWSADWSLSVHCAQKSLVLSEAAHINGINSSSSSGIGMITVLVAGAYMDRMGRKPVIRFFLVMSILVKLLLSLSCFLKWKYFVVVIIVQNIFEVMSASPMYPALNCMISDLTRDNEQKRGDCFSALEMAKNMASLLALLCGYPVLRLHLTNYFPFWSSLAVMAVLATTYFWNIPETFSTSKDETKSIWKSLVEGFQCCFKDRFLGQYLIIWGIVTLAVNGAWGLSTMYLQSFIGMEQADASMCRAFWFSALLCGAALSGPLMRQGVHVVHGTALLVMSVSWALCALGPVFPSHAAVLFWVFGVATFGLAFGVLSPCFASLICSRAPKELQGQVFGLAIVVGTLLGMPLGPLWSQVFFDPSATDLRAALPWLVSSALLGLMAVWFSIISALRSAD